MMRLPERVLKRSAALQIALLATLVALGAPSHVRAQSSETGDLSIELVDPKVLRVCADPRNMPFSNEKGDGFENKLAELFAEKLQKKLDYAFFPQATGFVRMTLGSHRCDVIMGFPQGDDLAQGTNPYYRTTYALEGIRKAILDGAGVSDLWSDIWPLLVIGTVSIPLGFAVFHRGEVYAKRHGLLKRSG